MKGMNIGLVILLVLGLVGAAVWAAGCGSADKLPTWNIGDKWVYRVMGGGIEYTNTSEVVGEDVTADRDSYVVETSFTPPLVGYIDGMSQKFGMETMLILRTQTSVEIAGVPWISATSYSYSPHEGLFPLEVGKELELTTTETKIDVSGNETNEETKTSVLTLRVEGTEEVSVPAGTFECFKIVKYDERGSAFKTEWYSGRAEANAKTIDHESGYVDELVSYSVR